MKIRISTRNLRTAFTFLTAIIALVTAGCSDNSSTNKDADGAPGANAAGPPGTEAGAKELLSAFLKPGADVAALSKSLRPTKADYAAVFTDEFAGKLAAVHDPAWESGALVLKPNEGQTELLLHAIPTAEIKAWSQAASDNLPGGYQRIKDNFKDGLTVYSFKFVKPGETLGMAFDGLVHVNGRWCIFPKPFRAA